MNKWLINGVADDRIPVTDRGFSYGDGLFETIAVRDGYLRFFDYHMDRLQDGAERLGIPVAHQNLFHEEASGLAADCEYGTLKIILTRGSGQRGYAQPDPVSPVRIVGLMPGIPPATDNYSRGIVVRHCSTPIGCNPATAGLKTLGRLEQVLARAEWRDEAVSEGLMSTVDGFVICGTMSNLFLVQDGALIVPDLAVCGINGVMRRVVLERAESIGLKWRAADISRAALIAADELFLTNSLIGLWPIRRVENHDVMLGAITQRLMNELAEAGVSECASA